MPGLQTYHQNVREGALRQGQAHVAPVPALFRNVSDALRFAFSIRERPLIQRQRFGDIASPSPGMSAMTPHDWHAQGALITNAIGRVLPPLQAAFIVAHYSQGSERTKAIKVVAHAIRDLHPDQKLLFLLSKRYFLFGRRRDSTRKIAEDTGMPRRTVRDVEMSINRLMAAVSEQCESRLSEYFISIGLVEG